MQIRSFPVTVNPDPESDLSPQSRNFGALAGVFNILEIFARFSHIFHLTAG